MNNRVALLGVLACVILALPGGAQDRAKSILPDDRRMDWRPGVPGGIPVYPLFARATAAPYGAKGDGRADDTASAAITMGV